MNQLAAMNSEVTMSSLDFLNNIINPARAEAGESEVKNTHFIARVEDELDDLQAVKTFYRFGNEVKVYELNMEQMLLVGMRESKAVRRAVLNKLKELSGAKPALHDGCVAIKMDEFVRMQGELIKYKEIQINEAMKLVDELKGKLKDKLEKKDVDDMFLPSKHLLRNIVRHVKCFGKMTKDEIVDSRRKYKSEDGKVAYKTEAFRAVNHLIDTGELVAAGGDLLDVPRPEGYYDF